MLAHDLSPSLLDQAINMSVLLMTTSPWLDQGAKLVGLPSKLLSALGIQGCEHSDSSGWVTNWPPPHNIQLFMAKHSFARLYLDSFHVHQELNYKDPICGTIAMCGLLHQTEQSMYSKATE